jgi:hypothetical protein
MTHLRQVIVVQRRGKPSLFIVLLCSNLCALIDTRKSNVDTNGSSSTAEAVDASQMSSQFAHTSAPTTKRGSHSQPSRSRTSADSSAATSWSPHDNPFSQSPSTERYPRTDNIRGAAHPHQVAAPYLLHIGAQFYEVVNGRTHGVKSHLGWNIDYPYQVQPQWAASNMAPIDRYQRQTIRDEPYG